MLHGSFLDDVVGQLALFVAFSVYIVVGALLLWRRPRHPIAWIMCGVGVALGVGGGAQGFASLAIVGRSDPLAGGLVAAWIANWYWYLLIALMLIFVPLLFPTGHLVSRRWRPVLAMAVVTTGAIVIAGSLDPVFETSTYTIGNPLGVDAVVDVEQSTTGRLLYGLLSGCAVAAFTSLVVRFRRARG
jgi:hypothetical protein